MARIAVILADDYEDAEFSTPHDTLIEEGHHVDVIGVEAGAQVTGKKGSTTTIERGVDSVNPDHYDALVIPGGYSPDHLRTDDAMVGFVRAMADADKPVAAICHAPWMLIEAGLADGRTLTSWPSLRTDLGNAGADWVDEEVVVDGRLITSRNPDDLPAFTAAILLAIGDLAGARGAA